MSLPSDHLTFYPAYCYSASPTWFAWVKLTCADVQHHLRARPGSTLATSVNLATAAAPNQHHQQQPPGLLLFYLNHPIQFLQLTGIVVAIDDYNSGFFLFTLDDSSGATCDVVYRKPVPAQNVSAANPLLNSTSKTTQHDAEPSLLPSLEILEIGTAVQAKGTLSLFRNTLQLTLLRLNIVPSTTAELALISARSRFQSTVLSKPWLVSQHTQDRLSKEAKGEQGKQTEREKKARERIAMRAARDKRHEERIRKKWEAEEKERAEAAMEARRAGEEISELKEKRSKKV